MSTFDDREKAFETKFAHDEELKFKAEARRNKIIAEWAAGHMGMAGAEVEDYVKAVRRADFEEAGSEDVVRKISADFAGKGVRISDDEIRLKLIEFLAQAVSEIEAG